MHRRKLKNVLDMVHNFKRLLLDGATGTWEWFGESNLFSVKVLVIMSLFLGICNILLYNYHENKWVPVDTSTRGITINHIQLLTPWTYSGFSFPIKINKFLKCLKYVVIRLRLRWNHFSGMSKYKKIKYIFSLKHKFNKYFSKLSTTPDTYHLTIRLICLPFKLYLQIL